MSRNDEASLQASVVQYIRTVAPRCLCLHVPMGGLRTKAEAAKIKWMGGMAGVPDLIVVDERGRALFLEIKTAVGVLSKSQKDFRDLCLANHWPWAVCRSINDVREFLAANGIKTREAV